MKRRAWKVRLETVQESGDGPLTEDTLRQALEQTDFELRVMDRPTHSGVALLRFEVTEAEVKEVPL